MSTCRINKSLIVISWIFATDHQNCHSIFHSIFFLGCIVAATDSVDVTFSISENLPPSSRVGILTDVNQKLRYKAGIHFHLQQIEYQSDKPLFTIDKYSGVIFTSREIDREEICPKISGTNLQCSISLVVSVVDFLINIRINISDVNDNPPRFLYKKKVIKIPENEETNYTTDLEQATDLDSAQYGIESYKIMAPPDSPFSLVYSTNVLKLKLTKPLDFEQTETYNFAIEVCDTGLLCSKQTIIVEVIDINDVTPMFQNLNYSVVVKETIRIGSKIMTVHASDNEKGEFGRIIYRVGDSNEYGSQFIRVDSNSGEIFLIKSLLGMEKIIVSIEAQDCGAAPKYAWTKLLIHIMDVNNNKPEIRFIATQNTSSKYISDSIYQIDIFENRPPNTNLAVIRVDDKDTGVNGNVLCTLFSLKDLPTTEVILQEIKGRHKFFKLVSKVSFDKENKNHGDSYKLNCSDSGVPRLSTIFTIRINIMDCNEYPPYFDSQFYRAAINEETKVENVIKFKLEDADATSNNIFFTNGTYGNLFKIETIDEKHGKLVLLYPVDREKLDRIDLLIVTINVGLDNKNFTSSSSVLITVIDINDNIPMLVGRSTFEVVENSLVESSLGKINIRDLDQGKNAQFSILSVKSFCFNKNNEELSIKFRISSLGEIRSSVVLDYEKIQHCVISVIVADSGIPSLTSTLTVNLQILDENDNYPQWIFPSLMDNVLNISISLTGKSSKLTRIRAIDLDKGGNENITYYLHSELDHFSLDQYSGQLLSINQLKPGKYCLQISAQDQGIPSKTNYSNLTLYILMRSSENTKLSSHVLLILGLIPTCALVILICAVIPIIFIIKWKKRQHHHRIPLSIETPLYHCPDVNHLTRSDFQTEIDPEKSNVLLKAKTKNVLIIDDDESNQKYGSMPPDLQNICDKIANTMIQSDYHNTKKPSVSNANAVNDIDVCSADSGQGASVEDVAGNYFKGHYDPLKYPYPLPGYHWCPILPEDKQVECHCSASVDQQYALQVNLTKHKSEENSSSLPRKDTPSHYSSAHGMDISSICWCQQCKYPNLQSSCVGVTNPICQVHSNLFPILFSHSHQNSTVESCSPDLKCSDLFPISAKKDQSTVLNTQV